MAPGLRRHRRFLVDLSAGAEGARLRDVSMGGMRVFSDKPLRIDEAVDGALNTESGTLRLQGRIVRACLSGLESLRYEYGIRFEALSRDDELHLRAHLDSLASHVVSEPEHQVEPLDLMRLQDRIAELEEVLARYSDGRDSGRSRIAAKVLRGEGLHTAQDVSSVHKPARSQESEEDRMVTDFDRQRFAHLVEMGQPLMPLVSDCKYRLAGDDCRLVARSFGDRFDLGSVKNAVGSALDQQTIVATLYHFYERDLIDFA